MAPRHAYWPPLGSAETCDLDACRQGKEKMFNFAQHRRPEHYRRIVDQVGAKAPT